MELSFPNQISGTVKAISSPGSVMAEVHVETANGVIASVVLASAIEKMGLQVGSPVTAVFRATDVSLATP